MTTDFKPTWLMIKRHTVTGLLYFCKTTKPTLKEALKYKGSGLRWVKHIKKHGRDLVTTEWISLFDSMEECLEYATRFSIENNIVLSESWANLVIETGLDHGCSRPMPLSVRKKISESKKGKPLSDEHKDNLKGSKPNARKPKTEITKSKISNSKRGKGFSDKHKENLKVPRPRSHLHVNQYDTDWNLIMTETTKYFCGLGFYKTKISKCCNGKQKSHGGYYWIYTSTLKDN